jgi:hypothetical protein
LPATKPTFHSLTHKLQLVEAGCQRLFQEDYSGALERFTAALGESSQQQAICWFSKQGAVQVYQHMDAASFKCLGIADM